MKDILGVPLSEGRFCDHFGGAQQFMICQVESESRKMVDVTILDTPPHKPGALPRWLSDNGVKTVLVGSMGDRAQKLLARLGIDVVAIQGGAQPEALVQNYLDGKVHSGELRCHDGGHGYGHGHGQGHGERCGHNHNS